MNNNGMKMNQSGKEPDERELDERAILRYTETLRRELNFRLLTEQDVDVKDPWSKLLAPERVLYVESIIVTDIRYPDREKSRMTGSRSRKKQYKQNKNRKERGTGLWQ